jgi:hypothetical protein
VDRALPSHIIDRIRDGVTAGELRAAGDKAVWNALVSTASSAAQRRWPHYEWAQLVSGPGSDLGRQAARDSRGRTRSAAQVDQVLVRAWRAAEKFLQNAEPAKSREEALRQVEAVADALRDAVLPDAEKLVLQFAVDVARTKGTSRPTLPRREVAAATGLGEKAVRGCLDRLDDRGLLVLKVRGRRGKPGGPRKPMANAFQLPDPKALRSLIPVPASGSVGPAPRSVGPEPSEELGPAPRSVGPAPLSATVTPTPDPETPMVLALAGTPEAVADALRLLGATDLLIGSGSPGTETGDAEPRPRLRVVS